MTPTILNCEDELIHFCGRIQNFGYLLVFDLQNTCVAFSENIQELLTISSSLLHQKLSFFENLFQVNIKSDAAYLHENEKKNKIDFYKVSINNQNYQLSVYSDDNHIFLEFEANTIDELDLMQLQQLQLRIDNSINLWQSICDNVYELISFDRIMVYQFLEDRTGIVVAESIKGKLTPVLGFRYPEFDIPAQARTLYETNLDRQTPDIFADTVQLIGLKTSQINLSRSKIRASSPIHLQYLKNSEVTASASFSIIIDNKLWGLVCCQHQAPKYITIEQRKLCTFLINSAAYKFSKQQQVANNERENFNKELTKELQNKLAYSDNLQNTLAQFANRFLYILSAKGVIIEAPNSIYKLGNVPSESVFASIKEDLDKRFPNVQVYTTFSYSNFKSDHVIDTDNCKGIARINFDTDKKHTLYFFRPEVLFEETWAGEPEKFLNYSKECNAHIYSPRASFEAWKKQVTGESEKWSVADRRFLNSLYELIRESVFLNQLDQLELEKKLSLFTGKSTMTKPIIMNNELIEEIETTKESAFHQKSLEGLSEDEVEMHENAILETTILSNYLLNKSIDSALGQTSNNHFCKVETTQLIPDIVAQALKKYQVDGAEVVIQQLYPVNGDPTLIKELFHNLIHNAVKFSAPVASVKIEITSVQEDEFTTYYIKDNGIGFEVTHSDVPFLMFKKLHKIPTIEGSGVGLAVVKRIVDRLKANISFSSKIDKGTTFKIQFKND
ncbi:GAF domain-containing protein [Flavobacterium agricola]|uniref:histidine kinase n=1 Tax=Flavobacterium agricola TaxID=2870839 RepID=A0ABY6LXW7_9FLAO|nr:ATP-binding protein [Flavobacterium agricola]UYW01151.1 GAF domain-containing protein [Flavobacterium agricola]